MQTNFPGRFLHWNQIVRCALCTTSVMFWQLSLSYVQARMHMHTHNHTCKDAVLQTKFCKFERSTANSWEFIKNAKYRSWKLHNSTSCLIKQKLTWLCNYIRQGWNFFLSTEYSQVYCTVLPFLKVYHCSRKWSGFKTKHGVSVKLISVAVIDNWNFKLIFCRSLSYSSSGYNNFEFSHHP
jgi:hypothetical protein